MDDAESDADAVGTLRTIGRQELRRTPILMEKLSKHIANQTRAPKSIRDDVKQSTENLEEIEALSHEPAVAEAGAVKADIREFAKSGLIFYQEINYLFHLISAGEPDATITDHIENELKPALAEFTDSHDSFAAAITALE